VARATPSTSTTSWRWATRGPAAHGGSTSGRGPRWPTTRNLLAVGAGANRSKGDANAASWLPPNKPYRCAYVARQIAVKTKYHLSITRSEKAQLARQLRTCPDQAVTPDITHAPTRVDQNLTDPGAPG
jgi:hypothetical protein